MDQTALMVNLCWTGDSPGRIGSPYASSVSARSRLTTPDSSREEASFQQSAHDPLDLTDAALPILFAPRREGGLLELHSPDLRRRQDRPR